jgi:hypothetical protein
VTVSTAKSTVETKLLVCVEHADEFRAVEFRDVEAASSAGSGSSS